MLSTANMLGVTRAILPKLTPTAVQTITYRTRLYQHPDKEYISLLPKDYGDPNLKVGPWPRTKEERERAAKKYNLIPEDYKPFDECEGWGDYPDLKAIGAYNRDPYDDFDNPAANTLYGEPYHIFYDLYQWERMDPLEDEKGMLPFWKKLLLFIGIFASFPTFIYLVDRYQLPHNPDFKARRMWYQKPTTLYEFPKPA